MPILQKWNLDETYAVAILAWKFDYMNKKLSILLKNILHNFYTWWKLMRQRYLIKLAVNARATADFLGLSVLNY